MNITGYSAGCIIVPTASKLLVFTKTKLLFYYKNIAACFGNYLF